MKKGDLITVSGRFATILNGPYTHRFLDAEDHEMIAHGMGEYAGVYCSAVDAVFHDSGQKRRVKLDRLVEAVTLNRREARSESW